MTSDRRVISGVGGLVSAVLGMMLVVGSSGAAFLLGVVLLVAGISLLVRLLLQLTEGGLAKGASSARTRPRTPRISLDGIKKIPALGQWVAGAAMGLLSLFGLFLYGRAADGMFAAFGGLLFLFGLAVIIVFVHKATDYSSPKAEDEAAEGAGHS